MKKFPSDSDAAIEGQLREALRARLAPLPTGGQGNACLDPETLAAWADDGLDARERAAAEAHAADCSRCQALLAAMIRTAEPAADATPWWRLPAMKWLVPLTAAATATVVWAIVPSRPGVQPPAPASSIDQLSKSQAPAQSSPEKAKQAAASDKNEIPSTAAKTQSPFSTDAASVRSPSPSVPAAAPRQREVEAPQAAAPAKAAQEAFGRVLRRDGTSLDIVSVDSSSRWRIIPGGGVQRSTDSGTAWETQLTGVSVTLVAGASPSPAVCWLVGPGGIVLLQTDGRSWRRIAFPEATDLASIRASDEKTATVTTTDGRMFSTADGGLTWTRSPRA